MDSRSVVAGLIDCGQNVRAFNYSYLRSADDILGRMIAEKLGVDYTCYHSNPKDRIKINTDYFALNAKAHFPRKPTDDDNAGRLIWSGDGGSVGLGHVYLTNENVAIASKSANDSLIIELFPSLGHRTSRLLDKSTDKYLRDLAISSVCKYLKSLEKIQPNRRLFIYFLLNDQTRHLYHHFEQIDLSNIEFETPFFDMDFVSFVASAPIDYFIGHRLYNYWISEFTTKIDETPWQAYPGHEPCPLPFPENILSQWGTDWYGGKAGIDVARVILKTILKDRSSPSWRYIDRKRLYILSVFNRLGISRYNYESSFARKFYEEVSGKLVFGLPSYDY